MGNEAGANEKIIMKDHDILIAMNPNVQNLITQVHGLSGQLQSNQTATFQEFKQVAIIQTEQKGEIANVRSELKTANSDIEEVNKRIDKTEFRWKIGDVAVGLGTVAALLLAWFK